MKERGNTSLKIENIVAAGTIADAIDLEFIANNIKDCTFTKKKFPGAVYHMQDPKSAALIFASGRVVLTGLHRADDIETALHNLLKKFRDAGITCLDNANCAVTNIVCTYNIGFPLNLVRIVAALMEHERVEYEPEAFPGLVCRISEPKVVFLLFSSGKIVITGGKNMDDVRTGLNVLMEKLGVVDPKITRIENF